MYNIWYENEDEWSFYSGFIFKIKANNLQKDLFKLNCEIHQLTFKYKLLMTLSPEYCEMNKLDYFKNYKRYLMHPENIHKFMPLERYEYNDSYYLRVSKIFYWNDEGEIDSSYVAGISSDHNKRVMKCLPPNIKDDKLSNYKDCDSPLKSHVSINEDSGNPEYIKCILTIFSNSMIWLDKIDNYFGYNLEGKLEHFFDQDNRALAYKNTPRLNSLLIGLKNLSKLYGGKSSINDYYSLLNETNKNKFEDAANRNGIEIDGKIIYQEDIDEGRFIIPEEYQ